MQRSPVLESSRRLGGEKNLAVSGALSILGIAVATYLTIVHYRTILLVCAVGGGCHTVQSSSYAAVLGIPVALLGLGMYLVLLGLAFLRHRRPESSEPATMAAFAISLAGVIYSGFLTYVELFVIDAICQWCVISAILTLAICVVEGLNVWRLLGPTALAEE